MENWNENQKEKKKNERGEEENNYLDIRIIGNVAERVNEANDACEEPELVKVDEARGRF